MSARYSSLSSSTASAFTASSASCRSINENSSWSFSSYSARVSIRSSVSRSAGASTGFSRYASNPICTTSRSGVTAETITTRGSNSDSRTVSRTSPPERPGIIRSNSTTSTVASSSSSASPPSYAVVTS